MERKRKGTLLLWSMFLVACLGLLGVTQARLGRDSQEAEVANAEEQIAVPVSEIVTWGSQGNQVRLVQQRLQDLGYYFGSVDGIYGTGTRNAIINFQRDNNLAADGAAGQATLAALGIAEGQADELEEYYETLFDDEVALLAAIIYSEARGEPYEGQVAVGAVVLNRLANPEFPNTIPEIVLQEGAFEAVADGQIFLIPDAIAIRAAEDALAGWDPVNGAIYYWNPRTATSRWIWSVPITGTIGRHVFGVR